MKTILQINVVVNSGSTGRIVEEIGQTVIANGWKSYIAYGRNEKPSQSELIRIGSNIDLLFHGLQTRLFDRHGLASVNATRKLIRQIEHIKPDLIHIHNIHGYYLNYKVLFDFLHVAAIPIVWTLHDCWPITGHCAHFDFIGCDKWKTLCFRCPQKSMYPASFLFDRSKTNFILKRELFTSVKNLTVVTVSRWLADIVKQSYLGKYPVKTIYNGINIETFKPNYDSIFKEKYKLNEKSILLGVSSVWNKRKGLMDYIKLSKVLIGNYKIILVGLDQNQLKKIPSNIIGIKKTENIQELTKLYSLADIVLNLSYEETFGLTTVEAFACGTPCIAYNCTASPELITTETGIVVEKGDINGLIKAVETIRSKGKNSYANACRQRAEKLYNKDKQYMEYFNLYETIITKY